MEPKILRLHSELNIIKDTNFNEENFELSMKNENVKNS